eukprot:Phypoly_transcript_08271.p1 GENE.Phypoly_transcript_08271~~Phypoly_transcript_08271.p1  ORF type:complete len:376 (+),score=53.06 Phypoly_transcript_08271:207-1334(+)
MTNSGPDLPPTSPLALIIVLFAIGLLIAFIIAMRNCCSKQLLSHHMHKKIARGGEVKVRGKEYVPVPQQASGKQSGSGGDYGTMAATRLFEDLYAALSRRKEKSGHPPKLPKAKKISTLHNNLCTKVTQIEQTLPLHIRTHSTFPILSLIIQDYVVFVRSSLIPATTKFIVFCNELTIVQTRLTNTPADQWQALGSLIEEKIHWMNRFADEVLRNSGELLAMSQKMFRITNAMYEEMRMSSVTQNLASEASKTEYVFHLLSIYDSFKKMSIILQFAHGEIKQTTAQLTNIQHLIGNGNYDELVQMRVVRGEVVQILASDATESIIEIMKNHELSETKTIHEMKQINNNKQTQWQPRSASRYNTFLLGPTLVLLRS